MKPRVNSLGYSRDDDMSQAREQLVNSEYAYDEHDKSIHDVISRRMQVLFGCEDAGMPALTQSGIPAYQSAGMQSQAYQSARAGITGSKVKRLGDILITSSIASCMGSPVHSLVDAMVHILDAHDGNYVLGVMGISYAVALMANGVGMDRDAIRRVCCVLGMQSLTEVEDLVRSFKSTGSRAGGLFIAPDVSDVYTHLVCDMFASDIAVWNAFDKRKADLFVKTKTFGVIKSLFSGADGIHGDLNCVIAVFSSMCNTWDFACSKRMVNFRGVDGIRRNVDGFHGILKRDVYLKTGVNGQNVAIMVPYAKDDFSVSGAFRLFAMFIIPENGLKDWSIYDIMESLWTSDVCDFTVELNCPNVHISSVVDIVSVIPDSDSLPIAMPEISPLATLEYLKSTTVLKIDVDGTVAQSMTTMVVTTRGGPSSRPVVFNVDKPFYHIVVALQPSTGNFLPLYTSKVVCVE